MKVALITGSNSGFGMLTTLQLAKQGYLVLATMRDLQNKKTLMKLAKEERVHTQIECIQMDVTNQDDIDKVFQVISDKYGKIDVVINNAGYCQAGFFEELTEAQWFDQFNTNVFGSIRVAQAMISLLRENGGGRIINISSVSGIFGFPGMSPYTSSKFAIEGLSESMRLEYKHENIWVSLVQPASYQTNIWERGLENIEIDENASIFEKNLYQAAHQSKNNGSNPIEVAQLIARICEVSKPKFRYPVGKGARLLSFLKRVVPWSIIERVVHNKLNGR